MKNSQENFKTWFKDLLNMEIPEWIISTFDIEMENANLDIFLKECWVSKMVIPVYGMSEGEALCDWI